MTRRRAIPTGPAVLAALILLLCVPIASSKPLEVLATGAADRLWVARVDSIPAGDAPARVQTTIFWRKIPGEPWRQLAVLDGRIDQVASFRNQLITVSGPAWQSIDSAITAGLPVPGAGNILALAGDDHALWAIRAAPGGYRPPATTQSTRPAPTTPSLTTAPSPATAPATQPLIPVLFQFTAGQWVMRASIPADLSNRFALALTPSPTLAVQDAAGAIMTWSLDADYRWKPAPPITTASRAARLGLVHTDAGPALWTLDAAGTLELYVQEGSAKWLFRRWLAPGDAQLPPDTPRVVTAAGQDIRAIFATDKDLLEQRFDPAGNPRGLPTPVALAPGPNTRAIRVVVHWAIAFAMIAVFVATLARRRSMAHAMLLVDRLNLAPLSHRIAAGLIDLMPLLLGLSALMRRAQAVADPLVVLADPAVLRNTLAFPLAIYVLHTALAEMLWARSIGKILLRLRVVTLAGTPPSALTALSRNLLRILDVPLILPMMLIAFSALRQRVGDVVAGTLVILDPPPDDEPLDPE